MRYRYLLLINDYKYYGIALRVKVVYGEHTNVNLVITCLNKPIENSYIFETPYTGKIYLIYIMFYLYKTAVFLEY